MRLLYGSLLIGQIKDAICSDATWHGLFESTIAFADGETARLLFEYIQFCIDWNERVRSGPTADPAEFDRYNGIINSGLWKVTTSDGDMAVLSEAPVFFAGGEISWRR